MEIIIATILSMAIAVVGAWIVYRIFNEKNGPTVGPFRFLEVVSERRSINMKYDVIKFKVGLPEGSSDIVSRELTITRAETAAGELQAEEVISTSMMELEFEGVQDTEVTLSCTALDNATPTPNRSEPKEITFTVADTIAPELTGDFSITEIDERTVGEEDPASSDDDSAATGEVGPDELGAAEAEAEEGEPTGEPAAETEAAAEADAATAESETEPDAEGESEPETTPGD